MKFLPGQKNRPAEKIIHQIKRDFAPKHQHTQTLPCQRHQVDGFFTIRPQHFTDFLCIGAIWQGKHAPERNRKCRTLKERTNSSIASRRRRWR